VLYPLALSPLVYITLALLLLRQDTAGAAFSFSQSYTQADAIPTSAPSTGAVPNYGSVLSYSAGSAGDLAGTVTSAGVLTVTAGGAGTTATGQYVSEITVID
tara:strand:- start:5466 stop:5771 length:306 start_codon:yes stop_codon:yes gene_type:complete